MRPALHLWILWNKGEIYLKKTASLLCVLLILLVLLCAAAHAENGEIVASGSCGANENNLHWQLDGEGTLRVEGTGPMKDYPAAPAPWYDSYRSQIKKIVVGEGVTHIGLGAFKECSILTDVTLSEGVESIGEDAFALCYKLEHVAFPESLRSIADAFYRCSKLVDIDLPDGVTSIDYYAFNTWSPSTFYVNAGSATAEALGKTYKPFFVDPDHPEYQIEQIQDENGETGVALLNYIGSADHAVVPAVIEPFRVMELGSVFWGNKTLKSVEIADGLTFIGMDTFNGCSSLTDVAIPDSVTIIKACAFESCSALEEIVIPDSVTRICTEAFRGCRKLKRIRFPKNMTTIESGVFSECSGLEEIQWSENLVSIGDDAFRECDGLKKIAIPDGVTSLGERAFSGCDALEEVALPDGLVSVGMEAFFECFNLKKVMVPSFESWMGMDINHYSSNPLYYARQLYVGGELFRHAVIPEGTIAYREFAFHCCGSLESITLPESLTSLGLFNNCDRLKHVFIPGNTAPAYDLYDIPGKFTVYCYKNTGVAEWAASHRYTTVYLDKMTSPVAMQLRTEKKALQTGESMTIVPEIFPGTLDLPIRWTSSDAKVANVQNGVVTALSPGQATITAVCGKISSSVEISVSMRKMDTLNLPAGLAIIGEGAFEGVTAERIVLSDNIREIGSRAFAACERLLVIYMPDGVNAIAEDAFEGSAGVSFICQSENAAAAYAKSHGIEYTIG